MTTFFAAFSRAAARVRSVAVMEGWGCGVTGSGKAGQGIGITSVGISRCTGPGLSVAIVAKAQSSAGPT